MTNFLCFVIALHVVSFANLYVIKNLNLNFNICLCNYLIRTSYNTLDIFFYLLKCQYSFIYSPIALTIHTCILVTRWLVIPLKHSIF